MVCLGRCWGRCAVVSARILWLTVFLTSCKNVGVQETSTSEPLEPRSADIELCRYLSSLPQPGKFITVAVDRCASGLKPNHYAAEKAPSAPSIDGEIDAVWSAAPWSSMDVFWLGAQTEYPSSQDYSGRFKALWDTDFLYLLVDITDDVIFDKTRDPLEWLWIDDTVEIFIDENRSGGPHGDPENFANAWAYHISTYKENVDWIESKATLLGHHLDIEIKSDGSRHIWEIRLRVFGDDYDAKRSLANKPLSLYSGKELGFSIAYIDNDNSHEQSQVERESMMGSVDTLGHIKNEGSRNASVLGGMTLVGD